MDFLATELTIPASAAYLGKALWFTAAVFGAILAAAAAGLAAEIVTAWTQDHHAPGAEFMGYEAARK